MKRGKRYQDALKLVDKTKTYEAREAIDLICRTECSAKHQESNRQKQMEKNLKKQYFPVEQKLEEAKKMRII